MKNLLNKESEVIKLAKRLRRKTQNEKFRERRPKKRSDWINLFSREMEMDQALARFRSKMQEIIWRQEGQAIGRLREEKVFAALRNLKDKGEIHDFLWTGCQLSYPNLIKGVDFFFTYIDGVYRTCLFSVTGWRWVAEHLERHPEIPTFSVDSNESIEFIEQKILALKNNHF